MEGIGASYHDLANLWEAAEDLQMADQVRKQEERALHLSGRLASLASLSATEAQKVLDEIKIALRSLAVSTNDT